MRELLPALRPARLHLRPAGRGPRSARACWPRSRPRSTGPERPIGLTLRAGWRPTRAQGRGGFLDHLRHAAARLRGWPLARPRCATADPNHPTPEEGGPNARPRHPRTAPARDPHRGWRQLPRCAGSIASAATSPPMPSRWATIPTANRPSSSRRPPDSLDPSGSFPYPPMTSDVHHEVELLVALNPAARTFPWRPRWITSGATASALDIDPAAILQGEAKKLGRPWEIGKSFERSGPVGPLHPVTQIGHPSEGRISLTVNAELAAGRRPQPDDLERSPR